MASRSRLLRTSSADESSTVQLKGYVKVAKQAQEARTKLRRILFTEAMDFKKTRVETVLACCEALLICHRKIVDYPDNHTYQQIKAANPEWQRQVEIVPATREFLFTVGWQAKVMDHERLWVFNAQPGTAQSRLPLVAVQLLEEAIKQMQDKLAYARRTDSKAADAAARELALMRFQDDRQRQRERQSHAPSSHHAAHHKYGTISHSSHNGIV